jgi:hypothetical protein
MVEEIGIREVFQNLFGKIRLRKSSFGFAGWPPSSSFPWLTGRRSSGHMIEDGGFAYTESLGDLLDRQVFVMHFLQFLDLFLTQVAHTKKTSFLSS